MSRYSQHYSTRSTPQTSPIPGKSMVEDSSGGFVFAVDDWVRLDRFLILGSATGSYYATERKLTIENAECVARCLASDSRRAVNTIIETSESGRAPKNAPAVFALAMAAGMGHLPVVQDLDGLNRVCRIPTDLFSFVGAVGSFRGWGPGLRRLVSAWYSTKPADRLAYLVSKYQSREGWSHRDVLRLSHATGGTPEHDTIRRWATGGKDALGDREVKRKAPGAVPVSYPAVSSLPAIIEAFEQAKIASNTETICRLIREHGLVREHVPTRWLNDPSVWEALLERMPLTAMIRSLGKMSTVGLVKPMSSAAKLVADRLGDRDYLRKSRVHPMAVLLAAKVYAQGHGDKGKLSWIPVSTVNDALDAAFYRAFSNVVPTGKRRLLALDVSGSMALSNASGTSLSCREAAAAMAMIVAKTETNHQIVAFAAPSASRARMVPIGNGLWSLGGGSFQSAFGYGGMHGGGDPDLVPLDISGCTRLTEVVSKMGEIPLGGTDCSLPMRVATRNGWEADSFEVYTDSETWAGPVHPCQALREYREKSGIMARLVVQGFVANPFTIADPSDAGSLDVVGLDAASPGVVADFIRGTSAMVPVTEVGAVGESEA